MQYLLLCHKTLQHQIPALILNFIVLKSVVTIGAGIGGLLGGWLVENIGRKLSLMLCSLPFIFGFTIVIAAQNHWMLYVGRVLTGLASGVTSLVVPVSH